MQHVSNTKGEGLNLHFVIHLTASHNRIHLPDEEPSNSSHFSREPEELEEFPKCDWNLGSPCSCCCGNASVDTIGIFVENGGTNDIPPG